MDNIRNFCIVAHIDHGKSTLADRFLELTKTISKREMKEQILDQMDLERERGITIKLQPVRMRWQGYILNLIDTPGHVDFTYEVSRSLAAVEGAILLVDATQGIQAQTLFNLYLAIGQNLTIIPVVNKIDLPNARTEEVAKELANLLGIGEDEIIRISAKTGVNVEKVLKTVVEKIPPPKGKKNEPFRALIFDSKFDEYKGVLAYVRVVDGNLKRGDKIKMLGADKESEVVELGFFKPNLTTIDELKTGEIGYIATGLKEVGSCRVGDTVIKIGTKAKPLPGYKEIKPMVFAGFYCKEGSDFNDLKEALEKLKLTDAALTFQQEYSPALGPGFRCGFLGLLHLDIIQERLKREFGLDLIITAPTVNYRVIYKTEKKIDIIHSPQELPSPEKIEHIEEPWVKVDIITPERYIGTILKLVQEKRGKYSGIYYFNQEIGTAKNVIINCEMPLASLVHDFYDKLKSVSSGFASLNYEFLGYKKADICKLNILLNGEIIEALAIITYKDSVYSEARKIVKTLKESLPRQLFEIKIQASVNGKIVAAERIPPLRKDVIAKLYGGDVTRKRKLLEKQKRGKKKMKTFGRVDIPPQVFLNLLKR